MSSSSQRFRRLARSMSRALLAGSRRGASSYDRTSRGALSLRLPSGAYRKENPRALPGVFLLQRLMGSRTHFTSLGSSGNTGIRQARLSCVASCDAVFKGCCRLTLRSSGLRHTTGAIVVRRFMRRGLQRLLSFDASVFWSASYDRRDCRASLHATRSSKVAVV